MVKWHPIDSMDHLPVLPIKHHTKGKLTILRKYLPALTKILRSKVPTRPRYYIDFFAGPGRCLDESGDICDGSPFVAVKTTPSFSNFIFVDIDQAYCNALRRRLEKISNINVIHGDCNEVVHEVLSMMNTHDPCFVFLDPFGLELKWRTIETLSKKRRIDILINFPIGAVHRSMGKKGAEHTVSECLGCDEWKNIRGRGYPARIRLRDLYIEKIQQFFQYISPKLVYTQNNVPLYYLIYGCHFSVGKKIWEDITKPLKQKSLESWIDFPNKWVYIE